MRQQIVPGRAPPPTVEGDGYVRFDCGDGSSFLVFSSSGKASGDHDQCGWVVDDIDAEIGELRRRGITFEEFPGYEFADGVRIGPNVRSAWFRDTEGNLLNVRSDTPPWGRIDRS